jgi:hypothetical protein
VPLEELTTSVRTDLYRVLTQASASIRLDSAPSVSSLVYQPPSLERLKNVRNSSEAVTSLASSLEPVSSTGTYGMPTRPASPPDRGP